MKFTRNLCSVLLTILLMIIGTSGSKQRNSRQIYDEKPCTLPNHPVNGQWRVVNDGTKKPGNSIESNTILQFSCNDGYKLIGKTAYVICNRDFDPSNLPECRKLCSPMYSSTTTTLKCLDKNNDEVSCSEATDGTHMTYSCLPYYEPPLGYRRSILCLDGTWNYPKPVCQPVCGKKLVHDKKPLVFGGTDPKQIEYPWITAIFKKENGIYINVCGGTLISRRVILTAAHCLTDENGKAISKDQFEVGVGKYYSKYREAKDDQAQYMEILHLIISSGYRAQTRNYIEDIALIVTKKLVTLSPVVQPVCISDINSINIRIGNKGELSGWGLNEDGQPSDTLRTLKIPYKDQTQCANELNTKDDFADKYYMIDKMCVGFFNQSMSVCQGDSGSGLYFQNLDDNRYYVHGIVSLGPSNNGKCAIQQNTLYTKVAFYYDFIDRELTKHYIEDCKLPPYPVNGHWSLENDLTKQPCDIVPSTTILKITCNEGFKLSSKNSLFNCESAYNMPTCDALCPPLSFPQSSKVTCLNRKKQVIECSQTADGSAVEYACLADDGHSYSNKHVRYCVNGSWGSPAPKCAQTNKPPVVITNTSPTPPSSSGAVIHTIDENYNGPKVFCTYASWRYYVGIEPEHLDPFLCTHMIYAFAGVWHYGDVRVQDDNIDIDKGNHKGLYGRLTDLKKYNKKLKVLLSIGGSKASNNSLFSDIAGDQSKISSFIGSAKYFLKTYHFDGLNIDWHEPDLADKENYVKFLSRVRRKFNEDKYLLTISVSSNPENVGYDAVKLSGQVDWVIVKTFDFYGAWSRYTGQNSALYASSKENDWEKSHLNIHASVNNWLDAGIPKQKLIMSIAFYARTMALKYNYQHDLHSPITGPGPGDDDILRLYEICASYQKYVEVWDDEQKTPFMYSDSYWFGFENKDSAWLKGAYAKEKKLAGLNIWPIDGDDVHGICIRKFHWLKHVHGGLGNNVDWSTSK